MSEFLKPDVGMSNIEGAPELSLEREDCERIATFIRHPSTRLAEAMKQGDMDTPWDEIEDKIKIQQGPGHEMSKLLANHLLEEIPQLVNVRGSAESYMLSSSPLPRAEAIARYVNQHIIEEHKMHPGYPLPISRDVQLNSNFREIPIGHTKGQLAVMLGKIQQDGKPITAILEEWFKSDPEYIASLFEEGRGRVLEGLAQLEHSPAWMNLVFTHRMITGLTTWLIEREDKERPIEAQDLPGIMEHARIIANTSETEIGLSKGVWHVLRRGETPHLDESLRKGVF